MVGPEEPHRRAFQGLYAISCGPVAAPDRLSGDPWSSNGRAGLVGITVDQHVHRAGLGETKPSVATLDLKEAEQRVVVAGRRSADPDGLRVVAQVVARSRLSNSSSIVPMPPGRARNASERFRPSDVACAGASSRPRCSSVRPACPTSQLHPGILGITPITLAPALQRRVGHRAHQPDPARRRTRASRVLPMRRAEVSAAACPAKTGALPIDVNPQ